MRLLICLMCLVLPAAILADGVPPQNGRYPGKVLVFSLTKTQRATLEKFRTCYLAHFQRMNAYTPYVFELSPPQAQIVGRTVGFVPSRFEVYETYRGDNDAGPHWNLALRYSADRFEIPLAFLLKDQLAAAAGREQGWVPTNPCFPDLKPNHPSKRTRVPRAA